MIIDFTTTFLQEGDLFLVDLDCNDRDDNDFIYL